MVFHRTWLLSCSLLVLAGCAPSPMDQAFVPPAQFAGLKPTDLPLAPFPIDGVAWTTLSQAELRAQLPNRATTVMIQRQNPDGSLSLAEAPVSGSPGAYTVIIDYLKFTTQVLVKGPNGIPALIRVGVGLRIRAQVVTTRPGLNLGSLLTIATASQAGDLTGSFSMDLLGLDAPDSLVLPPGAEISQGSVQGLLATVQAVEQRLQAHDSTFRPLVVAWRDLRSDELPPAPSAPGAHPVAGGPGGSTSAGMPSRSFQPVPAASPAAAGTTAAISP